MPVLPLVVIAVVLGAIIGSFLNVVVWRVPRGESIVAPPSACPKCGHRIAWHDNVPVLSWLWLRGRCRDCHEPISPRYPIVEATTAVVFGVVTWLALGTRALPGTVLQEAALLPALLVFTAGGIALALIDLDHQLLPSAIVRTVFALLTIALVGASAITGDWWALPRGMIGAAALFLFYLAIVVIAPRGMGGGDVRLAAVIGLLLGYVGWDVLVVGAFAAFVVGGVVGLALMAASRADRRTRIPFGPHMLLGAWIGLLAGPAVARWYLQLTGLV
jgi:leader peptidase (prepilin peptidase)/N-methyltransferase